ncbi:MAG: class I SAM-dependent methyltransferase [Minisyncoccia bacterium]
MNLIKKSIFILKNYGLKTFIKKAFRFPINRINLLKQKRVEQKAKNNHRLVIDSLKSFHSNNSEEIFNFSWNFYSGLIRPMQIKEEFVELLKIFQELKPKYIMEIGTANGGTLFCYSKLAPNDATIISIDLPEGPFGGGYPEWKMPIYQAFKKENQTLHLLREDSHQQETLEKVKEILNGNKLDFLFIDGDHSYEGVKKDFEMYSPLVKKGGIIAFHDIVNKNITRVDIEVPMLWEEIKGKYKFLEFVKDRFNYGIGVLYINREV